MKALIVGLGGVGQRHARNLRSLLGNELELFAYRVRGRAGVITDTLTWEKATDLNLTLGLTCFPDLNQALAVKPDIVVISNPSCLHIPVALAAARAGCHLFIEKPLSDSLDGVEELQNMVRDNGLTTMVGFQLRFHPCLQTLAGHLGDGAIGRVLAVRAEIGEYMPGFHRYEDYRSIYAARRDLGGGVVLTQIHELDYLQQLFGMPTQVFALGGKLSDLEIDVEDSATILMRHEVAGNLVSVNLHMDYLQRPPIRTCRVLGSRGKLVMDLNQRLVEHYDAEGTLVSQSRFDQLERNDLFLEEMRHFLDCVRDGSEPLVSLEDAVDSLRLALAIKDSMTQKRLVTLP